MGNGHLSSHHALYHCGGMVPFIRQLLNRAAPSFVDLASGHRVSGSLHFGVVPLIEKVHAQIAQIPVTDVDDDPYVVGDDVPDGPPRTGGNGCPDIGGRVSDHGDQPVLDLHIGVSTVDHGARLRRRFRSP